MSHMLIEAFMLAGQGLPVYLVSLLVGERVEYQLPGGREARHPACKNVQWFRVVDTSYRPR